MWLNRNDMVFNKIKINTFLGNFQDSPLDILHWPLLHKQEERPIFKNYCRLLDTIIMEVFAKFGWKFRNRITA
jgi:hypothetical protein